MSKSTCTSYPFPLVLHNPPSDIDEVPSVQQYRMLQRRILVSMQLSSEHHYGPRCFVRAKGNTVWFWNVIVKFPL